MLHSFVAYPIDTVHSISYSSTCDNARRICNAYVGDFVNCSQLPTPTSNISFENIFHIFEESIYSMCGHMNNISLLRLI